MFHCDEHRQPGDTPLEPPVVFQSVTLHGTIQLASGPWPAPFAQADAMTVIEAAIRQAGGLLNVRDVTSEWVRYWAERQLGRPIASQGGR